MANLLDLVLQFFNAPVIGGDVLTGGDAHHFEDIFNPPSKSFRNFIFCLNNLGNGIGKFFVINEFTQGRGTEDLPHDVFFESLSPLKGILDHFS